MEVGGVCVGVHMAGCMHMWKSGDKLGKSVLFLPPCVSQGLN